MHTYIHTNMKAYRQIAYIHTYIQASVSQTSRHAGTPKLAYIQTKIHTGKQQHRQAHNHKYIQAHPTRHTYIYTYIYINIHTYILTGRNIQGNKHMHTFTTYTHPCIHAQIQACIQAITAYTQTYKAHIQTHSIMQTNTIIQANIQ